MGKFEIFYVSKLSVFYSGSLASLMLTLLVSIPTFIVGTCTFGNSIRYHVKVIVAVRHSERSEESHTMSFYVSFGVDVKVIIYFKKIVQTICLSFLLSAILFKSILYKSILKLSGIFSCFKSKT